MWIMPAGWIYIMTNRPNGTLYVGATNDLTRRVGEHQMRVGSAFTTRYRLDRLVYSEIHGDLLSAIQREKNLKHWPKAWKVRLIVSSNPDWEDLSVGLI
jgi:putative endonuclease